MENQYNKLLSTSKTVSVFFENVYAPVLQTLPWIDDKGNALETASKKVMGNIAFPAYEFSSYRNQKDNIEETIDRLRTRRNELESIYQKMQDELRPILMKMPPQDRTWEKLQEMLPKWKNLAGSDVLPLSMHRAVEESFLSGSTINPGYEAVLGNLMADKIRFLHNKGESNHAIAVAFGTHGLWLERGFLHTMRHGQ